MRSGGTTTVKGTKEEATSLEGHSGRHLAERWGLPYREPHTLSIDPSALEIIDREESKRLRVLPLELGTDGPVFAVAEPSEERFAAVRELAGDNADLRRRRPGEPRRSPEQQGLQRLEHHPAHTPAARHGRSAGRRRSSPSPDERRRMTSGEPSSAEASSRTPNEPTATSTEHGITATSEPHRAEAPESSRALDELFSQITTGAGSLRGQVDELTAVARGRPARAARGQRAARRGQPDRGEPQRGRRRAQSGDRRSLRPRAREAQRAEVANESPRRTPP